jgi:hypothetical protein
MNQLELYKFTALKYVTNPLLKNLLIAIVIISPLNDLRYIIKSAQIFVQYRRGFVVSTTTTMANTE